MSTCSETTSGNKVYQDKYTAWNSLRNDKQYRKQLYVINWHRVKFCDLFCMNVFLEHVIGSYVASEFNISEERKDRVVVLWL